LQSNWTHHCSPRHLFTSPISAASTKAKSKRRAIHTGRASNTNIITMSKYFPKFKETLPNVDGKVFVITGTTSGTGFVAAQTVAEKGGEVVMLNRKSQRVTDAHAKLVVAVPAGKFVNVECDLQDFASVKKAAEEVKSKYKKIHCLSNNAGIMMTPDKATTDGCDTQMQTNHLSHFILTKELMPLLEAEAAESGDARIVHHSSMARDGTKKWS